MPAHRKKECWKITGQPGYIEPRNGWCRLRLGKVDRSLALRFEPGNKTAALKILRVVQKQYQTELLVKRFGLHTPSTKDGFIPHEPVTLFGAIDSYRDEVRVHESQGAASLIDRAIAYYLPRDLILDNRTRESAEATYKDVYRMMRERHIQEGYADQTRHKMYQYIQKVIKHLVQHRLLVRNPIDDLAKISRPRGSKRGRWTWEEADAIIAALARNEDGQYDALFAELLRRSGLRVAEARSLTADHARGNFLPASSYKGKDGVPRRRYVPVRVIPGLREVLDSLLALHSGSGPLIPWDYNTMYRWRRRFNAAIKECKIPKKGRGPGNGLRKAFIYWAENTLLMDRQDIFDIVGHGEDVDDEYYRETPAAVELEERIIRRRNNGGGGL